MKFGAVVLFSALWLVLVYGPMTHMVWGGEGAIMHTWGVLDFAGGTAVHINAGIAALVGAIVLGKRKGWPAAPVPPHNVVYTMIGAAFLWVGWFGFNVGSAFAVNASATIAMMTTMVATCGGILGWMVIEKCIPIMSRLWAWLQVRLADWWALPCSSLCRTFWCVGDRLYHRHLLFLCRDQAEA
jgi:Amt family ammonium transporter